MCNVLNEDTMTCDYGVSKVLSKDNSVQTMHSKQQQPVHRQQQQQNARKVGVMGSRRIFPPSFKLKVLHSYRNDMDCRGNQRATARKYGIHRRQIQKWLQCEESLKNCAENGNIRPASTSTTDSSASVSKSDSTTEATGPAGPAAAAISAAPTLNFNVARLPGDELTTQHKSPPPSPPHLSRGSASPPPRLSPAPRVLPKSVLRNVVPVGYSQYSSSSDRKHLLHSEAEDTMHTQEIHYVDTRLDRERSYYGDGPPTDIETTQSVRSGDRNAIVTREDIRYYWPSMEHQYTANDIDASAYPQPRHHHHHSPNHPRCYGDVNLFHSLYGLIGVPLIKTEPASPDFAATSGPYEPAGLPGGQWPVMIPQTITAAQLVQQVANNSSDSSSAHFNSAAGPSYVDVHVHECTSAHPLLFCSTPYSSSLLQPERIGEETGKTEKYCKIVIKEEIDLPEDEAYDERQENNASPYIDVSDPSMDLNPESAPVEIKVDDLEDSTSMDLNPENAPVEIKVDDLEDSTSTDSNPESAPVEIKVDDLEDFTSSPRDSVNSGRSSSISFDSEMESFDCTPSNQTSSTTPTSPTRRQFRRSFPLSFKVNVLNAFHKDADVAGNQRATARKFDINRRQVQKWLLKETDLREEITLRGDSRQRLAPVQEVFVESPVDLTISQYISSDHSRPSSGTSLEAEYEQSPPYVHCYEPITSRHRPNNPSFTIEAVPSEVLHPAEAYILPCLLPCADKRTTTSTPPSYHISSLRGPILESPPNAVYHSSKDDPEFFNLNSRTLSKETPPYLGHVSLEQTSSWNNAPSPRRFCLNLPEEMPPSLKRKTHSWNDVPSSKRFHSDAMASQNVLPQDRLFCLAKPKKIWLIASRMEMLAKSVAESVLSESDASQPSSSTSTRDGILFKPYLDNPVCRPQSINTERQENNASPYIDVGDPSMVLNPESAPAEIKVDDLEDSTSMDLNPESAPVEIKVDDLENFQRDLSPNIRENIINNNERNIDNGIDNSINDIHRYICVPTGPERLQTLFNNRLMLELKHFARSIVRT